MNPCMNHLLATRPVSRPSPTLTAALACLAVLACLVSGCLGQPQPVERYLRISPNPGECPQNTAPDLTIKTLQAPPTLDRSAVMLARGAELNPSLIWYWDGTPAELVSTSLRQAWRCQASTLWPTTLNTPDQAIIITGLVEEFEVEREPTPHVRVAFSLALSTTPSPYPPATSRFTASAPLDSPLTATSGQQIAKAASNALAHATSQAVTWLANAAQTLITP